MESSLSYSVVQRSSDEEVFFLLQDGLHHQQTLTSLGSSDSSLGYGSGSSEGGSTSTSEALNLTRDKRPPTAGGSSLVELHHHARTNGIVEPGESFFLKTSSLAFSPVRKRPSTFRGRWCTIKTPSCQCLLVSGFSSDI